LVWRHVPLRDVLDLAQLAAVHDLLQEAVAALVMALVGDGDDLLRLLGAGADVARVRGRAGHRLFAQHMQALVERRANLFVVDGVRRADFDGVQLHLFQHLFPVFEFGHVLQLRLLCLEVGDRLLAGVGQSHDLALGRLQPVDVPVHDAAAADEGDAHLLCIVPLRTFLAHCLGPLRKV
jgi:hypothetical protein